MVLSERTSAGTQPQSYPKRRMHHIFKTDGRAVLVAMDHARLGGSKGLENPREAVARVVAGGIDGILTTPGMAREVKDTLGGAGLIVALDSEGHDQADWGVELALRLGADAVELKVFPGSPTDSKLAELRRLAAMCDRWALPLLAEPIPVSFQETSAHTVENVARAARLGAEAGADFVKVHYVGPVEEYRRQVIGSCYVPAVVLGGAARDDAREALQMASDALEGGARGVVFGRNIIQHPRPDRMVAALCEIVHGGASVDQAARELNVPR